MAVYMDISLNEYVVATKLLIIIGLNLITINLFRLSSQV